jgi:uncharacterized paraquat-inducible protein A
MNIIDWFTNLPKKKAYFYYYFISITLLIIALYLMSNDYEILGVVFMIFTILFVFMQELTVVVLLIKDTINRIFKK